MGPGFCLSHKGNRTNPKTVHSIFLLPTYRTSKNFSSRVGLQTSNNLLDLLPSWKTRRKNQSLGHSWGATELPLQKLLMLSSLRGNKKTRNKTQIDLDLLSWNKKKKRGNQKPKSAESAARFKFLRAAESVTFQAGQHGFARRGADLRRRRPLKTRANWG